MERVHSPSRKKVSNVEGEGQEVKNEVDFETFNPMDMGEADGVDGKQKRLNSQVHDNLGTEIFQMKFDSEDDAHTFYNLFAKICRALAYIHNCIGLCHRDIKPQNLLIYSQRNIYEAGQKKKTFEYYTEKAADKEEAKSGLIRSEGDLFLKGAQTCLLTGVGGECVFHPSEFYPTWTMETASDSLKTVLQVCSGWQSLARPQEKGMVA